MPKSIKKLIAQLQHEDPSVRRNAAYELGNFDERALYPLIKALNDPSPGVHDAAMQSIISIGGEVAAYMTLPLLRANTLQRNTAQIILKKLGEVSVPLLYPLLKDKDEDVRKFAIDVMIEIKTGIDCEQIIPSLKDENANTRASAAKLLGVIECYEAIPYLIEALNDEEWVCFSALEAFAMLKDKASVPKIAELLKSAPDAVRYVAIETLGAIGSDLAVEPLMEHLNTCSDADERNAVLKSLIQIGITPAMSDICGHLINLFKSEDWDEKLIALKGIKAVGCKDATALLVDTAGSLDLSVPDNDDKLNAIKDTILGIKPVDVLLELLHSAEIKYRGKAFVIDLLGELHCKEAVPTLKQMLSDMRRDLRRASAEALGEIKDTDAVLCLLDTSFRDIDSHTRKSAIEALGKIGDKSAYEPLVQMLEAEHYCDIKEKIVLSLMTIDPERFLNDVHTYSDAVREITASLVSDIDLLEKFANDEAKSVKLAAIKSLGRVGTERALLKLSMMLESTDPDIRRAAVTGLGEAGYCASELLNMLKDEDPWVRFYAVKAVAKSCDRDKVFEAMREMLNDEFIPVVMSCIDCIKELGGREAYELLAEHENHPNLDVREKIREAMDTL